MPGSSVDSTPPVKGCLFDLDGTIYQSGAIIAGAIETLQRLRKAKIPYRFITNTTRKPRSEIVAYLAELGISSTLEDCLTPPVAAAFWLKERQVQRVFPLLHEPTHQDLGTLAFDRQRPEYLVVGDLGEDWSVPILNEAFQALMGGAELLALQKNRYWRRHDELVLDAGAFVAALEFSSGKTAHLIGKPSPDFFQIATDLLGLAPNEVVMIGDDLEGDVEGARLAGLRGLAVRTGKYRPADEGRAQLVSDQVLDSIADLPAWLSI